MASFSLFDSVIECVKNIMSPVVTPTSLYGVGETEQSAFKNLLASLKRHRFKYEIINRQTHIIKVFDEQENKSSGTNSTETSGKLFQAYCTKFNCFVEVYLLPFECHIYSKDKPE